MVLLWHESRRFKAVRGILINKKSENDTFAVPKMFLHKSSIGRELWWWIDHKLLHTVFNHQQVSTFFPVVVSYCQEIPKHFFFNIRQSENGKEGNIQKSVKKGSKIMRGFKSVVIQTRQDQNVRGKGKKKNTEYFLCEKQVPFFGWNLFPWEKQKNLKMISSIWIMKFLTRRNLCVHACDRHLFTYYNHRSKLFDFFFFQFTFSIDLVDVNASARKKKSKKRRN